MNKQKRTLLLRALRYIFHSLYFNFHYLPFKQAIRLPILLYKPDLLRCDGKILLQPEDGRIRTGMIQMGFRMVSIFPNSGITWENNGGTVIFRGSCRLGNGTAVSFGKHATVDFGDDFLCTTSGKIVSYRGIKFGRSMRLGWDSLCMDTNFHPLYDMKAERYKSASAPIEIGNYNWFGSKCTILPGVKTPERCIFGLGTVVTRGCEAKSYCVMGGSPVRVLAENVMRDYNHDTEEDV